VYNPVDAVTFQHLEKRDWRWSDKNCSSTNYLEDMKVDMMFWANVRLRWQGESGSGINVWEYEDGEMAGRET
jgi:hypothetical protein